MADIHESYQLLLTIVKARVATEYQGEKNINNKVPEKEEQKEKTKLKNLTKTPLMLKKKKK